MIGKHFIFGAFGKRTRSIKTQVLSFAVDIIAPAWLVIIRWPFYACLTTLCQGNPLMLKYILSLCLPLAVSLTALAADQPDDKAIQGSWMPIKAELAGQPMSDAVLKMISLKLTDGKYEVSVGGKPDLGTYTLDPNTKPKSITVTGTDGPNRGKTFPSIYELKDDTLRICYDLSGKQRPQEFKSVAGTKLYLVTYRRKAE
jgi:uncharacterized protein (TIGR03067 family)